MDTYTAEYETTDDNVITELTEKVEEPTYEQKVETMLQTQETVPPKVLVRPVVQTETTELQTEMEKTTALEPETGFYLSYNPYALFELKESHPPKGISVSMQDATVSEKLQRVAEAMMTLGVQPYLYMVNIVDNKLRIIAPGGTYRFFNGESRTGFSFADVKAPALTTIEVDCNEDFILMALYSIGEDSAYRVIPMGKEDILALKHYYYRD